MRICVVSDSSDFPLFLSETDACKLIRVRVRSPIPDADLYIWNYAPGADLWPHVYEHSAAQHLILADSKSAEEFGTLPHSACVLLKPASGFTIRAFIELARKTWEMRQRAREADALRLDRDALLQYVIEVNLKLQEYDQERNNFLARALHDFRAPLTALHGYCGLLAEGKLGTVSTSQRELLDRMRCSTRRLTRLASGTLELLNEGRTARKSERLPGDIGDAVDQALHDVYPLILDKEIEIDVQMEPATGALLFDTEQIQQVLVNLLENSSKFTPKDGKIVIRGYPVDNAAAAGTGPAGWQPKAITTAPNSGGGYRIDIMDSGPGIAAHLAEMIFEQYTSYGGTGDRSGGGLGLAICRAIVVAHGGAIWVIPSRDGGCFSFVLPARMQVARNDTGACSQMQLV